MRTRWLTYAKEVRRTSDASRRYKKGRRLYAAKRFAEAVPLLQQAADLIGEPPLDDPFQFGVKSSVRTRAVTLLAYAAAHSGDRALALLSIRRGTAVLAEWKLMARAAFERDAYLLEWEKWATTYAAHSE